MIGEFIIKYTYKEVKSAFEQRGYILLTEENEYKNCSQKLKTIFYKGIMPSEKVLDLPVDCNTLAGSVNL